MEITFTRPIVYITRDIERAMGLSFDTPNYHSITNATPFAKEQANGRTTIVLIEEDAPLSTRGLLEHPATATYLATLKNPAVVVFKTTPQIQRACAALGVQLLNPPPALVNKIENKIDQITWLGELRSHMPSHQVTTLGETSFTEPIIAQFNRGHTGESTHFIENAKDFHALQKEFSYRPVRLVEYIDGPTYTRNMVVGSDVLLAPISYQITGIPPFTQNRFATIGNDWITGAALSETASSQIDDLSRSIGKKLQEDGFVGACGIDVIVKHDQVYLIEINARQPASVTTESMFQTQHTTFAAHLAALVGNTATISEHAIQGAQIITRVTKEGQALTEDVCKHLKELDVTLVPGPAEAIGTELVRIIAREQLCSTNGLTDLGKHIQSILYEHAEQ